MLRRVSPRASPWWAAALVAFVACRSTTPAPETVNPAPVPPRAEATTEATPRWVGEPLSWEKLKEIDTWLGVHSSAQKSYWQIEGELQLNAGRLELSRREAEKEKTPANNVSARIQTARAGLQRVIDDPDASEGQKKRAQDALAHSDRMGEPAAHAPIGATSASVALIARAAWGAMPAHTDHMERNEGGWRRITVHHSAEPNPPPLDGSVSESAAAVRSIQKAHMEGKETHYGDIGYHFVIDPFGRVFQGRDLAWQGAHAHGDNNVRNIGVCLIGNFEEEHPTKAALESLRRLLDQLRKSYTISRTEVFGHCDMWNTECPGRYLERWVKEYAHDSSSLVRSSATVRAAALR